MAREKISGRNMWMMSHEDKYGRLPSVSESIVNVLLTDVGAFAEFMKHDPKGARASVEGDIEWLEDRKDFLGRAVKAAVDSTLELFEEKLTYKDYVELRYMLLEGLLIILRMLNRAST